MKKILPFFCVFFLAAAALFADGTYSQKYYPAPENPGKPPAKPPVRVSIEKRK